MLNFRPHRMHVKSARPGGFDEKGNPLPAWEDWGEAIPCRFDTDSREVIYTYDDGSAVVFSYVVWMDPFCDDLTGRMVKLMGVDGAEKDRKQVQKCVNGQFFTKLYL